MSDITNSKPEAETARASLELLYHISRELTTALDLRTVLQRVLFLSMRTVGAISGSIIVLDDNSKAVDSAIITGEFIHRQTTQRLRATLEHGLAGWVASNRQAVLVADTSRDERWMPRQYEGEEQANPKSAVSAPLLVRDKLIGVMTLVHPKPGLFTTEHLALVQAIADQASIAVLNARLYAESQRQTRVMAALAESAAAITGSLDLEAVLHRILDETSQALAVQTVSLALVDAEPGELVFRAVTGWNSEQVVGTRFKIGQGISGWVAQADQGVIVNDVKTDGRFSAAIDQVTGFQTRAVACAPIRYRGQLIGVLEGINPADGDFDPDALMVLTGIGSLAGSAIHHALLFERLQAAHQSYRELFDDSIDPIFITDLTGLVIEANQMAVMIGDYSKEMLHGMNIRQLHTIAVERLGSQLEHLGSGETVNYESKLRTRGQHDVPVQVYVRKVRIEGVPHLQWILRDITERKNLDTLREDLIAMIYHDLRSPLSNIISSLDVVATMLPLESDPSLRSLLTIALRSTDRIQRLTNSLLDINRLEAGQPVTNLSQVAVLELVNDAIETITPSAHSKQQTVSTQIPPRLPQLKVDADMIRRVLTNLLENSVKYSPVGGRIQVGAEYKGAWLQVWVQDTGSGIPASERERIFDKFTRLRTKDAPKGLGLGLAYCRLAVQGHGGRIWVESEPGAGSRFIFTLPVVEEDKSGAGTEAA